MKLSDKGFREFIGRIKDKEITEVLIRTKDNSTTVFFDHQSWQLTEVQGRELIQVLEEING